MKTHCEICEKIVSVLRAPLRGRSRGMVALGSGTEVIQSSQCKEHQELVLCALGLGTDCFLAGTSTIVEKIDLIEIHKSPANAGAIITAKIPVGSQIPETSLSTLYAVKDEGNLVPFTRGQILDPQWIDLNLPQLWETTCTRLHGGMCKSFPNNILRTLRPVWLVDVWRQCVVKAPEQCSYVALSYVWGNHVSLQAMRSNICQLQKPGSLSIDQTAIPIARTIRDAMGIVQLLKENYLWVDTLCIVQDDGLQKHAELAKMAAIYANASVAILAVQGENANSGLKGFRGISQPRDIEQTIHLLGTEVTVARNPIRGAELELTTDKFKWKTRGWTYQEHLFARRKLIFDGDSIRWECSATIWREHTELSHDLRPLYDTGIYHLFEPSIPDLGVLTAILHGYNRRSFTYPEDALNAFSGIASALSASFEGGFISGLPTALFDLALLWLPYKTLVRRTAKDPHAKHCLPSWSWAGWSGPIDMDDRLGSDFVRNTPDFVTYSKMQRVVRLLSWKYHETLETPGRPIHASIFAHKESYLGAPQIRCPPGWTRHPTSENPEATYDAPDPRSPSLWFYRNSSHPALDFWYPIPLPRSGDLFPHVLAPYLSCKTQRAWLFAAEEILPNNGYRPTVSLRDQVGTWVGVLLPHDERSAERPHRMLADPIELVEMAMGLCRDTTSPWPGPIEIRHADRIKTGPWYEYYWVMWIEWSAGVAYRKGLGRVCKHVWESQDRKPVDLILG